MVVLSFHRCGVFATFHRSGLANSTSQPGVPIALHFDLMNVFIIDVIR